MEENSIMVSDKDCSTLRCYTVKVNASFECDICDRRWSSHMATIVVNLYECKVDRFSCGQRCKECFTSWRYPKFTEHQFEEIIDRVIAKYWERKSQDDDGDGGADSDNNTLVDDKHTGNQQILHEQSLCERCITLGRPCW